MEGRKENTRTEILKSNRIKNLETKYTQKTNTKHSVEWHRGHPAREQKFRCMARRPSNMR